jgi:hypothetical protein
MVTNTSPLHQFRVFVAQRLQAVPFGWAGAAGYELERRYGDLIEEYWAEGSTVDDTAQAIHTLYMSRPQKVTKPTKASLIAAGCKFC